MHGSFEGSRAERDFGAEQSRRGAPVVNIKRGLMRLWIVASIGWVAFVGGMTRRTLSEHIPLWDRPEWDIPPSLREGGENRLWLETLDKQLRENRKNAIRNAPFIALIPPTGILGIG